MPAKPVLLIADDDPEVLSLLSLRFKKCGYTVFEAADGQQAIRQARERRPDVVILDVLMPSKNGWEVARDLRSDPDLGHIGIVMLTAIGEKVNELTSPIYGADEFVDKPFEFDDLEKRVKRVVKARRKLH